MLNETESFIHCSTLSPESCAHYNAMKIPSDRGNTAIILRFDASLTVVISDLTHQCVFMFVSI